MFFSDLLFNNQEFASALYNSLNENGIFIAQTGMASAIDDPSTLNTRDKHGHLFKERLSEAGFEHIREYEDVSRRGNCQFGSECQLSVYGRHSLTTCTTLFHLIYTGAWRIYGCLEFLCCL